MQPDAPLTPELVEAALEAMQQRGATFMTGGSRANTTYGWGSQGGYAAGFDEGYEFSCSLSDEQLRDRLRDNPAEARELLYRDARRSGIEALRRGDEAAVIAAIDASSAFLPIHAHDALLRALLRAASGEPMPEPLKDALRGGLRGFTFWHIVMGALGWERTPLSGEIGLKLLERAAAELGEAEGVEQLRASFEGLIR